MTNINNQQEDNWTKAREHKNKLLDHYNNIIKPKLLEFYELTGEDIKLNLNNFGQRDKPTIYYEPYISNTISYDTQQVITPIDDSIACEIQVSESYSMFMDDDVPNIKVIKVFYQYWNKILEYMDSRIDICLKDYESLLND